MSPGVIEICIPREIIVCILEQHHSLIFLPTRVSHVHDRYSQQRSAHLTRRRTAVLVLPPGLDSCVNNNPQVPVYLFDQGRCSEVLHYPSYISPILVEQPAVEPRWFGVLSAESFPVIRRGGSLVVLVVAAATCRAALQRHTPARGGDLLG